MDWGLEVACWSTHAQFCDVCVLLDVNPGRSLAEPPAAFPRDRVLELVLERLLPPLFLFR